MPTEPRQVPVSPQPDAARRRLHIHGIKEMPAGYDAEVAELFRDLRAATALSEMDLAARLGTRPDVVQALEQGALYALPPWAETCRVVNAYGALLNLDVRPLLRRIYAQLEAGIVELQPKAMPDVPVMTPPETGDFGFALRQFQRGGAPQSARYSLAAAGHAATSAAQPPPHQPWPNAGARPHAAPQAPRPNAGHQPQPQNAWPQAQPAACKARRQAASLKPAGRPCRSPVPQRRPPQPRPAQRPAASAPTGAAAAARRLSPSRLSLSRTAARRRPQPEPMLLDADFRRAGRSGRARAGKEAAPAGAVEMGARRPGCCGGGVRPVVRAQPCARLVGAAISGQRHVRS